MSKKVVMAKLPGYVWLKFPAKDLDSIINAVVYEYSYEHKLYHRAEDPNFELKVVDEDCVFDTNLEDAKRLKNETE